MGFNVYILNNKELMYIIDEGCIFLGKFIFDMFDILKGMNWGVNVYMIFSGIEIIVIVVDKNNFKKVILIIVDFFGW